MIKVDNERVYVAPESKGLGAFTQHINMTARKHHISIRQLSTTPGFALYIMTRGKKYIPFEER